MKITSVRFERAVHRLRDEPKTSGPVVVFLGRSNVGKSSLINRLLGSRSLARTSSRPGRTQSLNFYRVNDRFHFVDLPGYGYAAAPEAARRSWAALVEGYLESRRRRIALGVLVLDARHRPTELDAVMRDWLEAHRVPYVIAATKSDKLAAGRRAAASASLREFSGADVGGPEPVLVSAASGTGIREIWRRLDAALIGAGTGSRGRGWTSEH